MTFVISSSYSNFNLYCFKLEVSVKCCRTLCSYENRPIQGQYLSSVTSWEQWAQDSTIVVLVLPSVAFHFQIKQGEREGVGQGKNDCLFHSLAFSPEKKPRLLETDQSTSRSWTSRETAHVCITDRVMETWYPSLRAFIPYPILCCFGTKILELLCAERSFKTCRKVDIRREDDLGRWLSLIWDYMSKMSVVWF